MNLLRHNAEHFAQRVALSDVTRQWTWRSLHATAASTARRLHDLGVRSGDTVSTLMDNSPAHVILLHAIWLCGATAAPLNTRLALPEHARQLALLRPVLLIVQNGIPYSEYPCHRPQEVVVEQLMSSEQIAASEDFPVPAEEFCHAGPCSILFTSGTAGVLKAVPHTWENHRASATGSAANLGVRDDDNWLCVIPLSHIGGLAIVTRSLFYGTALTIAPSAEPAAMLALLRDARVTLLSVVPTVLQRMMDISPECSADAMPELRAILLGGAGASARLWGTALDRGLPVLGTYGLTESCSQVVTASPEEILTMAGTAGRPIGGALVRICDTEGRTLPPGELGEIRLQGPMLTAGYIDATELNASRFVDGWFRTGDQGMIDEAGLLHVRGRCDDVIVTGGENVHPSEIEEVLLCYPGMREAVVVGIPDPEWGERIAAAVVSDAPVEAAALEAWCRTQLAGYKIPRRWIMLDVLPKTGSGKLSRREVRRLFGGDG